MAKPLYAFLQEEKEPKPVLVVKEDILPGVSAQDDMVVSTWKVNALSAGHWQTLTEPANFATLKA